MMEDRNTTVLTAASALASLVDESPNFQKAAVAAQPPPKKKALKKKPLTFPQKLMNVLSMEEYSDIIVWLPHGKAFAIISPREFVSEILPNFFKRAKYSSFTRKLHRWGFQRRLRGSEAGSYYHRFFQRDNETLCTLMSMSMSPRDSSDNLKSDDEAALNSTYAETNVCVPPADLGTERFERISPGRLTHDTPRRLSYEAAQMKPNALEQSSSKRLFQSAPSLQAPRPTLLESTLNANVGADQLALEQLLLTRRLQARYRAAAYSRMLMNPLHVGVEHLLGNQQQLLGSASSITGALLNQISSVSATPNHGLNQVSTAQKITTDKYDVGSLSMLSMMPPSA